METPKHNPISITSKIDNIVLDDFKLVDIPKEELGEINRESTTFEFNVSLKLDSNNNTIELKSSIKFFKEPEKIKYLGEINTTGHFQVQNITQIIRENNGFPQEALSMFIGVVIATTRGMLIMITKGTFMEGIIIPIINLASFFNSPLPNTNTEIISTK